MAHGGCPDGDNGSDSRTARGPEPGVGVVQVSDDLHTTYTANPQVSGTGDGGAGVQVPTYSRNEWDKESSEARSHRADWHHTGQPSMEVIGAVCGLW